MTHRTLQPTTIATVPAGYADGLTGRSRTAAQMLVHGQRVPIVGRVCMDLTMLDVGAAPGVQVGDEVVIFGPRAMRASPRTRSPACSAPSTTKSSAPCPAACPGSTSKADVHFCHFQFDLKANAL